jgi:hypothetical protein
MDVESLADEMERAFQAYAAVAGAVRIHRFPGEDPQESEARIRKYGEEFAAIIREEPGYEPDLDPVRLRQELDELLRRRCPPLDLIELSLICSSGITFSSTHMLRVANINRDWIEALQKRAADLAIDIAYLNELPFGGLLEHLGSGKALEFVPRRDRRKLRRMITVLPETLHNLRHVLKDYVTTAFSGEEIANGSYFERAPLAYYCRLLHHFGGSYETASLLLKATRAVRYCISRDNLPPYVSRLDPHRRRSPASNDVADPLSTSAIQRSLHRFQKAFPIAASEIDTDIAAYLSPAYGSRRAEGDTLLVLLPELQTDKHSHSNSNF